ncbi:MAG: potassium/proton antiporter [Brotaphodocola sp.]
MNNLLLLGSLVIIACILCNRLSTRFGFPMLLAFIVLGMVFGSEGIFRIHFDNFLFAENICTVALIFIMFYGGFGTRWKAARPAAAKALFMSSFGTVLTALLTGLFCHLVLGFGLLEGLLTGAVLGSTDAASVFSVLRSKKLSLKYHTDSLLELESGSNDPFAYMLTLILLSAIKSSTAAGHDGTALLRQILVASCSQLFFGLVCGIGLAWCVKWFLEHFTFDTRGFDTAFILAAALLSYALPTAIGGNGYLSAYVMGILLGNSPMPNKKALVNFFDGLTSLMQMLIFFLLGLLSYPSRIGAVWLPSLAIALFLTLIARPLAVILLTTPFRAPKNQQLLVSWSGLRGAASIVFAIMVVLSNVSLEHDLFHIVFCVVLLSITIQGSLLPWFARRLDMLDQRGNILTTFNDYTEETDIRFIDIPVRKNHPWIGLTVRELKLPPATLLVFLRRGKERLVPNGDTIIREQDSLVLGASAYTGEDDIHLKEISVNHLHPWCNQMISQLALPKNSLIIMICRGEEKLIPNGQTRVLAGDLIVLNSIS